jgi:hypothetical protein
LTDQEATRKNSNKEFVDICFQCFPIEVNIKDELDEEIEQFLEEEETED